jgi:hypothetical protein
MLVEVRVMRQDGRRIAREQLRLAPPHRGNLQVLRRRGAGNDWFAIALLTGDDGNQRLAPLDHARLMRWSGVDLVLTGVEHVGRLRDQRQQLQAWWVRLLEDAATAPEP